MGIVTDDKHKLIGRKTQLTEDNADREKLTKMINLLSKQVLGQLTRDKIPPTPENFKVYFEKQVEKKSNSDKKKINELLELESAKDSIHTVALEKDIREAFLHIKNMTESVANTFANLNQLKKLTEQKLQEIKQNPSTTILVSYEENLEKSIVLLTKELKQIKDRYNATAELIKDFNQNSIYDKKYSTYNKKYLLKAIQTIIKNGENFKYSNTLLAIKIKPQILAKIKHQNDKETLKMILSKLLLKRSRRSDIVAHYENGIFMIILKHTDTKQAKIAIERIEDMIDSANFIIDSKDINVELEFGLASITKDKAKEEIIIEAIDKLS